MTDWADDKLRNKLRKLFALLGSNNANESAAARAKIDEILAKRKKTWNDLTEVVFPDAGNGGGNGGGIEEDDDAKDGAPLNVPPPLDLIYHVAKRHLHLSEHQLVALTLWIAHSHLYDRFSITPRLVLLSPVRGCGKSTAFSIIKELGFKTRKSDHTTPAVLFRVIQWERPTLLLDECDNQDLLNNSTLRSLLNSSHRHDGKIFRFLDGMLAEFSTFAPMALATIGRLPLPLMHRSIVLHMERSPHQLARFDPRTIPSQQTDCDIVYREALMWAKKVTLNLDPPLPEQLSNRPADNWRPLISIADACSAEWGKAAREAAIALSKYQDEDFGVILLADIRAIFDRRRLSQSQLSSAQVILDKATVDMAVAAWCYQQKHEGLFPKPIRVSVGSVLR